MEFLQNPGAIEKLSMSLIDRAVAEAGIPPAIQSIVYRMIHATGDVAYADLIKASPDAVTSGIKALRARALVITDVHMVEAGVDKGRLASLGGRTVCLVDHPAVVADAACTGITRAMTAMRHCRPFIEGNIVAVGNAPTALFSLLALAREGIRPALAVGTPVGFVGAAEAKAALAQSGLPYITVEGTKGGSGVAAAAVNALLRLAKEEG